MRFCPVRETCTDHLTLPDFITLIFDATPNVRYRNHKSTSLDPVRRYVVGTRIRMQTKCKHALDEFSVPCKQRKCKILKTYSYN
jgi:hypothetical protein